MISVLTDQVQRFRLFWLALKETVIRDGKVGPGNISINPSVLHMLISYAYCGPCYFQ